MKIIFILATLVATAFAIPRTIVNDDGVPITSDTGSPNITDTDLDERSYHRISFKACHRRSWAVRCCGYGSGRHRYHCQDAAKVHDNIGNENHFCEWRGYSHGPFCCNPKLVFKHRHYTNMCDHLIVPQIQSKEWEYVELWRNGSWPVSGFQH